tara:strand:+ start:2584 stop:4119 length:1536 start_codon:yes stop_codon:yes gene_type:complete
VGDQELILLAQQLLQTPEGKELINRIGIEFDIESVNQKIKDLENRPDRDTRQKARAERRTTNAIKTEEARKARKEARTKEIQKLRAQLKANIPVIREFPITGRVYWLLNKDEKVDYSGVEIKVLKGALVKQEIPISKLQSGVDGFYNIKIKAVVLPSKVTINVKDEQGNDVKREFEFRSNDIVILRPQLVFLKSGIPPTIKEITNLDNSIKSDLGTQLLLTIKQQAKAAINSTQLEIDSAQSKLNPLYFDAKDNLKITRRAIIMDVNNVIKTRLIPLAVTLLISFGITKISQIAFKTCPSPEQLRNNIKRRNRIVRQLNQAFATVVINVGFAALFIVIQKLLKGIASKLRNIPIPLISQPYTTVGQLQEVEEVVEEVAKTNKDLNRETIIALVFLVASITTVLILLNTLDKLTEECAGEENLEFEPINQQLQDLTEEQAEEGFPIVTEVNGFTMGVELEKNSVGSLTRRYAIAKNKQGIIQLRGEPSFSSTDQILIDELAFYITLNNLKAF